MSADALFLFVPGMGEIYGDECCTYNVHLLIHLTRSVEYLDPLWSTSMFKFEGYNRIILTGKPMNSGISFEKGHCGHKESSFIECYHALVQFRCIHPFV